METTADTIKRITRDHLLHHNGLLFGQCVTAIGWINGTVPELTLKDGIVELPISDVSNSGITVGAALAGRRPIYVIRFQGLGWYNLATILNYAAKSKEMWEVSCPVFVRAVGVEGHIGPVASHSHHSMCCRMPGIIVKAPMTPNEWENTWQYFIKHDDPVYCSEHRSGFLIDYEIYDDVSSDYTKCDCIIFAISAARLNALKAQEILKQQGIKVNIFHIVDLKPFEPTYKHLLALSQCGKGIVIDSDYKDYGVATHIAHNLMLRTGKPVYTMGLADRSAGFATHCDNITPTPAQIIQQVKTLYGQEDLIRYNI